MSKFKRITALFLSALLFISVLSVAAFAESTGKKPYHQYTVLGDSIPAGYGPYNYEHKGYARIPVSYPALVADQVAENMIPLARTGFRTVELRYMLEDDFEGDEYLTSPLDLRSKFLWYKPHIAILTGIAWDHINVFPTWDSYVDTFRQFTHTIDKTLIYFGQDPTLVQLAGENAGRIQCLPYDTYAGNVPMQVFGRHNMQDLQAACLACEQIGIDPDTFYRTIASFTGAGNRLEKIAETPDFVAYKDFAHSPSKLQATINAVRERYPERKLIACMELHTFSSLTADFLPQYNGTMNQADEAIVYFNQHVIEHKHLTPITTDDVKKAFGQDHLQVYTDSRQLEADLLRKDYRNTALLLMSSGTFDGINVKELAQNISTRCN